MESQNAHIILPEVDDEDIVVRSGRGLVRLRDGRGERLEGHEAERVRRLIDRRPANDVPAWRR